MKNINEKIEVIAWFKEGKTTPIRFKWRNQAIKINQVIYRDRKGSTVYNNLVINYQSELHGKIIEYKLEYNTEGYNWKLLKTF